MADLILNGDDDSNSCALLLCENVPDDTRRGFKRGDLGLCTAWPDVGDGFIIEVSDSRCEWDRFFPPSYDIDN